MLQIFLAPAQVNSEMIQTQAARLMKVSKTIIVNWEKGRGIPGIPELSMLCEMYGMPNDNIFLFRNLQKVELKR